MTLDPLLRARLRLPLIAAPMTGVSSLELVIECCRHGVVGSFPTHAAATSNELRRWFDKAASALSDGSLVAPLAPNLVVHPSNPRLESDVQAIVDHGAEIVITSVGSPEPVISALHAGGCAVFADVATLRHAERAIALGVDGLILLTAGAGGQTGWLNPFAFVRAVRQIYDGTVVLAGGIGDGQALFAATALGADLAYMGTKFIATQESAASPAYRQALVAARLDDVGTTTARTGLPANFLRSWLERNGLDTTPPAAPPAFDLVDVAGARDEWAAGQSVYGVTDIPPARELIARIAAEFAEAAAAAHAPG